MRALLLLVLTACLQAPAAPPRATSGSALILGRVVDAAGGPVAEALAVISPEGARNPRETRMAFTNAQGRFVFSDLSAGSYSLNASKAGYVGGMFGRRRPGTGRQTLVLADGQRTGDVTITMWKYAVIGGTIVDERGEPLIGVTVAAHRRVFDTAHARFTQEATTTTDDRGVYRLASLVPGDYVVSVSAIQATVPVAMAEAFADAAQAGSSNVFARALNSAGVSVSGMTGGGLRVGDLILQPMSGSRRAAVVPPPPTADGRLFAYSTVFYPGTSALTQAQVLTLASGADRSGLDLRLGPSATSRVTGAVTGPDGPVAGIGLRLVPDYAMELSNEQVLDVATTASDARGVFTFLAVPPGQYTIRAIKVPVAPPLAPGTRNPQAPWPAGQTLWANVPVAVGDQPVTMVPVALSTGFRISGRFEFDGTQPKPDGPLMEALLVQIQPIDGHATSNAPISTGQVDAAGEFSTYAIPPGRYSVRMSAFSAEWNRLGTWVYKATTWNGRDIAGQPLDLRSDVAGVIITMTDRPAEISGVAYDAQGRADPTAAVVVFSTNPSDWTNYGELPRRLRNVRVSRDGRFSTNNVPPGEYFIAAVPDEESENWLDPKVLEKLSRIAVRVQLTDRGHAVQDVTTKTIR